MFSFHKWSIYFLTNKYLCLCFNFVLDNMILIAAMISKMFMTPVSLLVRSLLITFIFPLCRCLWTVTEGHDQQLSDLDFSKVYLCELYPRMVQKKFFSQKQIGRTRHASALRLVWKNPKGFLISAKFRGSSSHFRFDHFYIVYFTQPHLPMFVAYGPMAI